MRNTAKWINKIDDFDKLPLKEQDRVIEGMRNEYIIHQSSIYPRLDIYRNDKSVLRALLDPSSKLLNSLYEIPGVIIFPFDIMEQHESKVAIKYPLKLVDKVTKFVMNYIIEGTFTANIFSLFGDSPSGLEYYFLSVKS